MAKYTLRSGANSHPEDSVLQLITDLVIKSGVISAESTDFKVTEDSPQTLGVVVKAGRAYLRKTSTNTYPIRSNADEDVAITSNSSGNPRKDAVVVYVDLAETPDTTASDVVKFAVVAGTPAASPQPPSDSAIATAIGSGNPFLRLGNVTVASGTGTIANANIEDTRVDLQVRSFAGKHVSVTDGATVTFDLDLGDIFTVTIDGDRNFAIDNAPLFKPFMIRVTEGGAGGHQQNWWANIKWPDGVTPVQTPTAGKTDVYGLMRINATDYEGHVVDQNI